MPSTFSIHYENIKIMVCYCRKTRKMRRNIKRGWLTIEMDYEFQERVANFFQVLLWFFQSLAIILYVTFVELLSNSLLYVQTNVNYFPLQLFAIMTRDNRIWLDSQVDPVQFYSPWYIVLIWLIIYLDYIIS